MAQEKRLFPRKKTSLWIKEVQGDYYFLHNVSNLSEGGMFIDSAMPVTRGKNLLFSVHLPDTNEIKFEAQIIHTPNTAEKKGFGVKFTSFKKGTAKELLLF